MTNTALLKKLIDQYEALSYTNRYIFGVAVNGNILALHTNASILPYILTLDSASRNGGASLRYKPTKVQVETLRANASESYVLCSVEYFEELVKSSKYNRGEIFEMLVTEHFGQEWVKDNVPFTEGGDIEVDGVAYQIKYNKATFANEASLRNLSK